MHSILHHILAFLLRRASKLVRADNESSNTLAQSRSLLDNRAAHSPPPPPPLRPIQPRILS